MHVLVYQGDIKRTFPSFVRSFIQLLIC